MGNLEQFKSFVSPIKGDIKIGTNAVIYTRVSSHSQEDNTSLESQKKYCEKFAERRGLKVLEYFGGTYESAKTDDRKEFNKMLSYVKRSKNITYVVVYSYERFSRSGINGASIADDLLKKYGVITLAVTQELDPTTPSGSFQQKILFLFGQMDNDQRRDKTVTGMKELLMKGYYLHSLPRGFTNLNKGSKAVNQKIVVNEQGKLLRKAFEWKANKNMSVAAITRKLDKLGYKIDERRIHEIFKNPFYCGLLVSKMLPGEVIQGNHEQLVSRELFLKVNNIGLINRNHPETHNLDDVSLPLKRFMKCGACDTPMTGFLVKKKGLYYYKCRTKDCRTTKSAKALHTDFTKILASFQINEDYFEEIKIALELVYDYAYKEKEENTGLIKRELNKTQTDIDTIEERYALGKIKDDIYSKLLMKYERQKNEILKELGACSKKSSNLKKVIDFSLKLALQPLTIWKTGKMNAISNIQNFLFPNGITYNRELGTVQTFEINSFFALIPQIASLLAKRKKGDSLNIEQIPPLVIQVGFKPITARAEI